jgi:hypothetical protein
MMKDADKRAAELSSCQLHSGIPTQTAMEPVMTTANRTIEDRLRAIEDRLEIYNLIASHPPSADTGADYYTRVVYVEEGELDLGRGEPVTGNESIAAITKTAPHQAAIAGGLAHFAGLPRIELEGDSATVVSYLQILTPHPTAAPHEVPNHGVSTGFRIHRVAANRWELERTADGWKIRRRSVRTIDGTEPPRDILRAALRPYQMVL